MSRGLLAVQQLRCLQDRPLSVCSESLSARCRYAAATMVCMQCDLWRALRLPGILVGDGRLGGISTTIAAYDCLRMRGCDVPAIVLSDSGLQNWKYLKDRMSSDAFVLSLPECPPAPESRSNPLHSITSLARCIPANFEYRCCTCHH